MRERTRIKNIRDRDETARDKIIADMITKEAGSNACRLSFSFGQKTTEKKEFNQPDEEGSNEFVRCAVG